MIGGWASSLAAVAWVVSAPPVLDLPPGALVPAAASVPVRASPRGLSFEVPGFAAVVLPFRGVHRAELELEVEGAVVVSWGPETSRGSKPWRYQRLETGPARLELRPMQFAKWTPWARPVLRFEGTGRVVLGRARIALVPEDPAEVRALHDAEVFLAPETVDHATINVLVPPFWSVNRNVFLQEVLAVVFLAVALAALLLLRWRAGRWRPGTSLAIAASAAVALQGAHFAVRMLPALHLSFDPDPEERIAKGYPFMAEFGELARLARARIGTGETVGALARPDDWFSGQTLCFNLAPRRCVVISAGRAAHRGISGVGEASLAEIDVIVAHDADSPLPPGFVAAEAVSPRSFIARRTR